MEGSTAYVLARRRADAADAEAAEALAAGQNARQMVLNRDPRFIDLAAIVSQMTGDMRVSSTHMTDITAAVATIAAALAANSAADQQTRDQLAGVGEQLDTISGQLDVVSAEYGRLDAEMDIATAKLAAADEELSARLAAAEAAIRDEAATRAAADAAEALARAQADAAEARARADADAANQAKQDAAVAAEAAARQAADAKEVADRAAADVALAARIAALENYMPAVTSGRATRTGLTIGLNATVDIPVLFDAQATDTNYVPVPVLDAPILANFTPVGFKNKTRDGVTVTLRANAAITLAVTLSVTVIALKL